ncbi:hypothetical protein AWB71_06015 [Caballeronia peredens]|nr:hypothetical protein AWB71_06015 [Caballeronia peredens]
MNISLDFDGTYTEDPASWNHFIDTFTAAGHNVMIVTMRHESEANSTMKKLSKKGRVIYTDRKAKEEFVAALGITIDVWIDDTPAWIYNDAAPRKVA